MQNNIDEKEQKDIQIDILKEIKKICEENNLTCFLGGGTLLGAIRHKGYIPWDDDIDIMMPRKDYEEFLTIFNEKCDNKYKVLSYKNTDDYYYSFAKVVDLRTILIENNYKKIKDLGIYIDVFPIDFLPNNEAKVNKIMKKYKKLSKISNAYCVDDIKKVTKNKFKFFAKKIILYIIQKFNLNKKILTKIDTIAIKYKDTDKVACITGRYAEKEIMPSSYIEGYILVDFEGEKYKAPIGYDEYLTKHYGDYMQLPPKEKQIKEHNNEVYWR